MNKQQEKELRETLANIEHQRWADWQKYMHGLCVKTKTARIIIPAKLVSRWERQIKTPYKDLSEKEKDSDREQVDRYFPLIKDILAQEIKQLTERYERLGKFAVITRAGWERKQLLKSVLVILSDIQRSESRSNIGGEFYNKTEVDGIIDNFRDKIKEL